ncbi:translocation/assembly module TamB domain-containing protein [Cyclonatronum proteinivorum]|nr:translocation/assembly module TamB domain-containing protein [Cyclonatronum proteinivorum]
MKNDASQPTQAPKPVKKRRRWPWILLLSLLLLGIALRMALKSDWVFELIRAQAVEIVSGTTGADFQLDRMEGDLLSGIRLYGARLTLSGETEPAIRLDTLEVDYKLRPLLRRTIEIPRMHLSGLDVRAEQLPDSSWNLMTLVPEPDPDEPESDEPFGFTLQLTDFELRRTSLDITAPLLLPDERLRVEDLLARATLTYSEASVSADLHELSLLLREGRLPEPIRFETAASLDDERITLDRLVLSTGRSLLEAEAAFDTESTDLEAELTTGRISRADLLAYIDEIPAFDTASLHFAAGGSLRDFETGIRLHAPGLLRLDLNARLAVEPEPLLRSLRLELAELNLPDLAMDSTLDATAGILTAEIDGEIPLTRFEASTADIRLNLTEARFEQIGLRGFEAALALSGDVLTGRTSLRFEDRQRAEADFRLAQLWEERPQWQMDARFRALNPGYFVQDDELDGSISGTLAVSGEGFEPGSRPWKLALALDQPRVLTYYQLGDIRLNASITGTQAGLRLLVESPGGRIELDGDVTEWQEPVPAWQFGLVFDELDTAVIAKLEDVPTFLNGRAQLEGRGISMDELVLRLETSLSNSRVLGEPFDRFDFLAEIEDGILHLRDGEIDSRFLSGSLTARQRLDDFTDPDNRLDLDLEISNIQAFAGFLGAEELQGNGRIAGVIRPDGGVSVFEASLLFDRFRMDEFTVQEAEGSLKVRLIEEPELELTLGILQPAWNEMQLADITLQNTTRAAAEETTGDVRLNILRTSDFGLFHEGQFRIADTITYRTERLDLLEDGFELLLETAFGLELSGEGRDQTFRMDELRMGSDNGAALSLQAFSGPNLRTGLELKAERLDLGAVQEALMDERLADLMFSGQVSLLIDDQLLQLEADTEVTDIRYDGLAFDRFTLSTNILNERMEINSALDLSDTRLMEAQFSLPFRLGDKEDFPDSFYDEIVEGYLIVPDQNLEKYRTFMDRNGLAGLRGRFSLESALSGTAGAPGLTVRMALNEARASGVAIENFFVEAEYNNEKAELAVTSELRSLGQVAAEFSGTVPFYVDMRSLTVEEPEGNEGIQIEARTRDFDLAAFSDFLDPEVIRGLRGRLNADILVTGTAAAPEPNGTVRITDGRFQLVENNIVVSRITADTELSPDRLRVREFRAESSGSLTASGYVTLADFQPDVFSVDVNMRNFRAYNTRDLDAFVSMNARLEGTLEAPVLTGGVTVERGYIYLDNFGERQVEQVVLDDEDEPDTFAQDFFDALEMEFNVVVTRRFSIRNRSNPELELGLEGDLDVVKAPFNDLEVFGLIETVRGVATTLGRRFELEEGQIVFSGPADNPEFDIQLIYRVRREDDILIRYSITGDVDQPEFSFSSEPEMELQDIISYTLFGRPFHALQSWEQGVSGGASATDQVADAALDLLLDRLQSLAADRLGVDVVEIETSNQSGGGTRVKAGKFLSDRLFVALVQELGSDPNSQVIIEYLLRRNLELIITGSDDFRTGIDILWRLDY